MDDTVFINWYSLEYSMRNNKAVVTFFGRDANSQRVEVSDDTFHPFFYIREDEVIDQFDVGINRMVKRYEKGFESIDGTLVQKVHYNNPFYTYSLRDKFLQTFESNIEYITRYLVSRGLVYGLTIQNDRILPAEPLNISPRKMYVDIECVRKEGWGGITTKESVEKANGIICAIGLYDSYMKQNYTLFYHPTFRVNGGMMSGDGWTVIVFNSEEDLLKYFITMVQKIDPDYLIGWNSESYDFPMIINRMKRLKIDYRYLSPMRSVTVRRTDNKSKDSFVKPRAELVKDYYVRIKGRQMVDLMIQYKVLHKNEGISKFSLDNIAWRELKKRKRVLKKGYYETWMEDPVDMIDYCQEDVRLTVGIDEKDTTCDKFENLRRVVGLDMRTVISSNLEIGKSLMIRVSDGKVIPVVKQKSEMGSVDVTITDPAGKLLEWVLNLDLNALYMAIILSLNVSPETMCEDGDIVIDQWRFRSSPMGILPKTVASLMERRKIVQEAAKAAMIKYGAKSVEYERLDGEQAWMKRTMHATGWGVSGVLFDPMMAKAIPHTASTIIESVLKLIEKEGKLSRPRYEGVYGDTDSAFVKVHCKTLEKAVEVGRKLEKMLNEHIDKLVRTFGVKNPQFNIELGEVYRKVFFKAIRRYQTATVWKKGETLETPKIDVTGEVRGNYSYLSMETDRRVAEMLLLEDKPVLEVRNMVRGVIDAIKFGKISLNLYGIPESMGKDPSDYKKAAKNHPRIRSRKYSNKYLGTNYHIGNVNAVYVKQILSTKKNPIPQYLLDRYPKTDVIAFEYVENISSDFWKTHEIDYDTMIDKVLKARLEGIFKAHSMSWKEVITDELQDVMDAWMQT